MSLIYAQPSRRLQPRVKEERQPVHSTTVNSNHGTTRKRQMIGKISVKTTERK